MKKKSISKLYRDLANKEKANLAFVYRTESNEAEFRRIYASVPRAIFEGPSPEYSDWYNSIFAMASWWAIQHWKAHSNMGAASLAIHVFLNIDNDEPDSKDAKEMARNSLDASIRWESKVLALDRALDAICKEHGIDAQAVRRMAQTDRYDKALSFVKSNDNYEREVFNVLDSILAGYDKHPICQDDEAIAK
jgi:hypothetical protein